MMKLFFKSMVYAVKDCYKEYEGLILFFIFVSIPITGVILVGKFFNWDIVVAGLIAAVVGAQLFGNYMHCKEAIDFSKANEVSFEEAWVKTKKSNNDWDEY